MIKQYTYYIGIDCGVTTGYAVYYKPEKKLWFVESLKIHQAMDRIASTYRSKEYGPKMFIRVEDPRLATFGRNSDVDFHKAQGAGSVKRDASIWEDFLTDLGVPFEMVRPNKKFTKIKAVDFKKITGYTKPTSNHGRDAAFLVYGF